MSPEARREQLLDTAVSYIVEHGLSDFTLENLAVSAGVSKPLVYKYFPNRDDLLKAMLEREYRILAGRYIADPPADVPVEPQIRASTERGFEYLYERGPIVRLLGSDRGVAELVQQRERSDRSAITTVFIERLQQAYGVPHEVAMICSVLAANAPIQSVRVLKKGGVDAKRAAQVWSDFVIGGWKALQAQYRDAQPPDATPRRAAKARR